MKIHLDLPGGGRLDIEREPMNKDKFNVLCGLAAGAIIAWFFIRLVAAFVG